MSDDSDSDPMPPPDAPPTRSDGELWLELYVVLTIGVFPPFFSSLYTLLKGPTPLLPYWIETLVHTGYSVCTISAVLYLIHRSGESWSSLGVPRLEWTDVGLGFFAFLAWLGIAKVVFPLIPAPLIETPRALPQVPLDYGLMLLRDAANGFAEELVVRAYLIIRLERLLHSSLAAVLISTLLFASYHCHYGMWGTLEIAILGLVYGVLFAVVPRVWPFAVGHMLYNCFLDLQQTLS